MLAACAGSPEPRAAILAPSGLTERMDWTADEAARDVAIRTLGKTDAASSHAVRLLGAEKPHVHDRSDLFVFVLRGRVRMHLGDRVLDVFPGDAVEIPRGVVHWAENTARGASEAYVVFAPPFDGKDRRLVAAQ